MHDCVTFNALCLRVRSDVRRTTAERIYELGTCRGTSCLNTQTIITLNRFIVFLLPT